MSDVQTDPKTTNHQNWMIRFLKGFVNIALMPVRTRLIGLVLAGVIVFAGGAYLFNRQERSDARAREQTQMENDDKVFEAAQAQWERQVIGYQTCRDAAQSKVESRDKLRAEFIDDAISLRDSVLAVFPLSPEATAVFDAYVSHRQEHIDQYYAPYDLPAEQAKCQPPGPEPIAPISDR